MKRTIVTAALTSALTFGSGASDQSSAAATPPAVPAAFANGTAGAAPAVDPVSDLAYRKDVTMNSWFAIGHFEKDGHKLDFLYHVLVGPAAGGHMFEQGAISITDEATGKYIGGDVVTPFAPGATPERGVDVKLPNGFIAGDFNGLRVNGKLPGGSFDMRMAAESPVLYNGGTGVFPMLGMTVQQYSVPRLRTTGTITLDDKTYQVQGVSWFDRQWQNFVTAPGHAPTWTWMDINLDNGDAISLWSFKEPRFNNREVAWATILHRDGSQTVTALEPTSVSATDVWTSHSGARYPTRWTIKIPQMDAVLAVVPKPREQEIVSQLPPLNKYEGAAAFTGRYKSKPVKGYGYVELVGGWK